MREAVNVDDEESAPSSTSDVTIIELPTRTSSCDEDIFSEEDNFSETATKDTDTVLLHLF